MDGEGRMLSFSLLEWEFLQKKRLGLSNPCGKGLPWRYPNELMFRLYK